MTFPQQGQGYSGPGAPPPAPEGGGLKLSEHIGDLVWAKVVRYDPSFTGKFGTKEAIILDIEVVEGRSEVGIRYPSSLHTNGILVGQLQNAIGTEMFARVGARQGQNANPAIFFDSPRPGDEAAVNAFLARRQQQGGGQQPQAQQPQAQPQQSYQQPQGYGQPQGMPPTSPPPHQSYDQPPF